MRRRIRRRRALDARRPEPSDELRAVWEMQHLNRRARFGRLPEGLGMAPKVPETPEYWDRVIALRQEAFALDAEERRLRLRDGLPVYGRDPG